MNSITGAGATFSFTVTGVEGAAYSIADAGAAQDEDCAGATSSVTGGGAVKVPVDAGAACSNHWSWRCIGARRCRCRVINY